jgi:hypothetical protein
MHIKRNESNMQTKLKPIPDFKTEDEEFEFWSTADSTEYLDPAGWRRVPPPMVPKTQGLHGVILSPEMEHEVHRLSRERKIDIQEMITQLLAAGLKQQRLQPGA